MQSAISTYRKQSVLNATPVELVALLYDEAIACTWRKDRDKLLSIFSQLIRGLNFDYELAGDLFGLYSYCQQQVRRQQFEEVRSLLEPIREAWREAASKKV
jgi:flagellin-specific chaperone FliS